MGKCENPYFPEEKNVLFKCSLDVISLSLEQPPQGVRIELSVKATSFFVQADYRMLETPL